MKKMIAVIVLAAAAWSCSTFSQNYKLGTEALMTHDWDQAISYLERAVLEDPKDSVSRMALTRARISASEFYLTEARKQARQGHKEEALNFYQKSLSYDPSNIRIAEEAQRLAGGKPVEKRPPLPSIEPPVKLVFESRPMDLRFTDAGLRSIFITMGKHSRINVLFDEGFQDMPFSIDLTDMDFARAVDSLCLASKNFYKVINENTIIVVPNLPGKKVQYEDQVIRTFYLSNIKIKDIQSLMPQLLRSQFSQPNMIFNTDQNSVTVRDVPEMVEMAGRLLRLWDKPKAEIVLDLEIMEVSRQKLRNLGLDLSSHVLGFQYGGTPAEGESGSISLDTLDFSKAGNFQITLPTSMLQFLETDVDTKVISQPRLRGISGEEITYLVGDEVPVPNTTFLPYAAGGVSGQPVTSYEYKNVGIDVKVIPTVHLENEITLELEIKIKALAGSGYADLPIISTRTIKNIIRLKDGETNLLAGLLKDEERKTKKGIIGLNRIPLLGDLFSSTDQTVQQTDVILTITPYIIRSFSLTEEDTEPIWFNQESSSSAGEGKYPVRPRIEPPLTAEQNEEAVEADEIGSNYIYLNPSNFEIPPGREFRISVVLRSTTEIGNMSAVINFDPSVLTLKDVIEGSLVRKPGENVPFMKHFDPDSGNCTLGFSSPQVGKGITGRGILASLVFESKAQGSTPISITSISANAPSGKSIAYETAASNVRVR